MKYFKQTNPFVVPTTDGKTIREHFGLASTEDKDFSLAHMIAPPGWSEPYQTPEFDEVTFVFKGQKKFIIDEQEEIIVAAGESILIKAGTRIQYSNPFEEDCHYVALCRPAFSMDAVHREESDN
jgi:ethanolamine utilization protein EutQ